MIESGSVLLNNFYRQLWFTTMLRVSGLILGFVSTFLITILLPPEEFGIFIFLSTLFGLLSIGVTFGYERTHIQVTSGVLSTDTIDRDVFSYHSIAVFALLFAILISSIAWIGPLKQYSSFGTFVSISFVTLVSLWLTKMVGAFWRAREDALRSEIVISAVGRAAPIPLVAALLYADISISGFGFLLLTSILTTVATLPFAAAMFKSAKRGYAFAWGGDIKAKALASSSHMFQIAATSLFDYVPIIVLGIMALTVETGVYGIVFKIFIPVVILHQIVAVSFFPRIAATLRKGALDDQTSTGLRYASAGCGGLILVYAVFLILIGESILSIFGEEYLAALVPALILVTSRGLGDLLIGQPTIVASMDGSAKRIALAHTGAAGLFLAAVFAMTALDMEMSLVSMALLQAALMIVIQITIMVSAQAQPVGGFSPALAMARYVRTSLLNSN